MPVPPSEYQRTNNSFSGVDIKVVFGNRAIGEVQGFSYSVTREKAPIYTMGSADPRAFSRGKRGIAGTLIFIVFDRDALLSELSSLKFQSDKDDLRAEFGPQEPFTTDMSAAGISTTPAGVAQSESQLDYVGSDQELASAWYADQLPPFDITLCGANEYGALCVMKVLGVELLNEGAGVSIDDLVIEQQYSWVARSRLPWQQLKSPNIQNIINGGASVG